MRFSENWLREWINPAIDTGELVAQLTMAGLEVDSVERAGPSLESVVVGEILDVEPHPEADKLVVCQVAGGNESRLQVVCGAPNARAGLKVPFALVGASLPNGVNIKKAKLRGVESFGMLCGQTELALGDDDSGLWELPEDAPEGKPLADYLKLNDNIIEVDLTPNRGDCLSLRGLAREVGVLNKQIVNAESCEPVPASIDDAITVELQAPEGCARYVGRILRGLDVSSSTPQWMQERLRRSGLRSLGPVVDVTNYVMLELGQPMHAFDLSRVEGGIVVRQGRDEKLSLLDDSEVLVDSETLVIADNARALAMAGIMGGSESAVSHTTTDILLESAWFNPLAIAGRPRRYGKHTDSSHRFERGVDPELQVAATERATRLILDICGGQAGPVVDVDSKQNLPRSSEVRLRDERLRQQLGIGLERREVADILSRLGLEQISEDAESSTWKVPSWRFDLEIEQDLIEEVARIYGYNRLPVSTPKMALDIDAQPEQVRDLATFRDQLIARGYHEVVTYSFVDPDLQSLLSQEAQAVKLQNPISADMSQMRTSLWPGLVQTALHNLHRQQSRVRIFETGLRFLPGDKIRQESTIAGLICGSRHPVGWTGGKDKVDFFDIKGDLEAVLAQTGMPDAFSFVAAQHPALHPGQSASVLRDGSPIGWVGRVHPAVLAKLDIATEFYLFELDLSKLTSGRLPAFVAVSKFPEVRRDLAFFVPADLESARLLGAARGVAGEFLTNLKLFDLYHSKDIENKGKSVAIGLTFQHFSRTLSDEEVAAAVNRVVEELQNRFGAVLRG